MADSITRHTFRMILQLILSRLVKTWYINLRQIRNSTKDVLIETKYRSVNVKQSLFKARWSNSSLCLGLEFCVFISIQDKKECFKWFPGGGQYNIALRALAFMLTAHLTNSKGFIINYQLWEPKVQLKDTLRFFFML